MARMKFALITAVLFIVVLAGGLSPVNAKQDEVSFDSITIKLDQQVLELEYATTYEQRAMGLMFRKSMCEQCGMLFNFGEARMASLWMKNTFIPLDVAFIDREGVITDIRSMKPHDLTSVGASRPIVYALEMNKGWFSNHDVQVGDKMTILDN